MQINRVGIGLIAFFFLAGIGFTLIPIEQPGRATFVLIGVIWSATALGLLVYALRQRRKAADEDWLFKTGIKGKATVVEASSNMEVNEMPVMKLVVDLDFPGQAPRRATKKVTMSRFCSRRMEPGLVMPAVVNPTDPEDLILVW